MIITLNITTFTLIVIVFSAIQWFFTLWLKSKIEKSIQHKYDKQLEEYRLLISRKEKAANVSNFFAKWIKYRGFEKSFLDKNGLVDYYEDLNRMSFDLALWIEDEDLLTKIMARLQLKNDSPQIRQLLIEIRDLIFKSKTTKFDSNEITIWPTDAEIKDIFNSQN